MENVKELLNLLSTYGGEIVCTAALDTDNIKQAQASNRMYVDDDGIGFVWMPKLERLPETNEELKFFEKWFPLEMEVPEHLQNLDWFFKRLSIEKQKKNN